MTDFYRDFHPSCFPGIGMESNIAGGLFQSLFSLIPMQHSSFSCSVYLTFPAFCTNGLQMPQSVIIRRFRALVVMCHAFIVSAYVIVVTLLTQYLMLALC